MRRLLNVLCLITLLSLYVGCGGDSDPRQIDVSGTASINGKPIETGKIFFTPDAQAGNMGPMGIAKIKNGKFDTSSPAGRGVLGGEYTVRIENYVSFNQNLSEGEFRKQSSNNPIEGGFELDWTIPDDKKVLEKDFNIEPGSK